jgi:hypothetical protein
MRIIIKVLIQGLFRWQNFCSPAILLFFQSPLFLFLSSITQEADLVYLLDDCLIMVMVTTRTSRRPETCEIS